MQNSHNKAGLFFKKRELLDPTPHYRIASYALLNYIRYTNTPPRNPIIPDSTSSHPGGDAEDGIDDISNMEGVTVV
jgi:hypothetical protein